MATAARAQLTPATNQAPAVARIPARELSGAHWVPRFPGSVLISDLSEPFQTNVNSFFNAITAAGGSLNVGATYRPPERAWLMHYSASLAGGRIAAADIPAMAGVNIEWVHPTEAASVAAAVAMARGYNIVHPPAIVSRHTARCAVDVTISNVIGSAVADASGNPVMINRSSDLHSVGASYGVHKLVSDPPHWSDNGH